MSVKPNLIIHSNSDFEFFRANPFSFSSVEFKMLNLTFEENLKLNQSINKRLSYCGCDVGKYFLSISFLVLILSEILNWKIYKILPFYYMDFILKIFIITVSGKMIALLYNYVKLKITLKKIVSKI